MFTNSKECIYIENCTDKESKCSDCNNNPKRSYYTKTKIDPFSLYSSEEWLQFYSNLLSFMVNFNKITPKIEKFLDK